MRNRDFGRRIAFILLVTILLPVFVFANPLKAEAANFNNSISSFEFYPSGCLKSMSITIDAEGTYATAYGKIAVHTQQSKYGWNNRWTYDGNSSWPATISDDGFVTWGSGDEFLWSDGNPHAVIVGFNDGVVNLNSSNTYYVYLWTRASSYGIYPDALVYTLKTSGGKLTDDSGNILAEAKTHIHKWSYQASGNQIKAWCTETEEAEGKCNYQNENNALILQLSTSDATCTGVPYSGIEVSGVQEWKEVGLSEPVIKYEGTGDTIFACSTVGPINAGTYSAYMSIGEHVTDGVGFSILKKSIAANDIDVTLNRYTYEYDTVEKGPEIIVKDTTSGVTLVKDRDYKLDGDLTGTDISSYTITVTGIGNYKDSVDKTWHITKKIPRITILPTATPITYGALLRDSAFIGGKAECAGGEIEGSFAWTDQMIKPSVSDSGRTAFCVTFTPSEEYAAEYESVTCNVTVNVAPKTAKLVWLPTTFTYDGKVHAPDATVANLEPGDKVWVTVSGVGTAANTPAELENANGGYMAEAVALSGEDAGNYVLPEECQTKFKIYPKKLTAQMITATTSYTYDNGNEITPILSVKDGNKSLQKGGDYFLSGDVAGSDVKSYTVTVNGNGNYSGSVNVAYKITDNVPPTGKIILGNEEWTGLINAALVEFNRFYTKKQTVKITAEDENGVGSVAYFLTSGTARLNENELSALSEGKWKKINNGGTITLNPDNSYVIYVKITDVSGNVTFLSTDGIVVDANAPTISGISNGKTYCSDVIFTVSDKIGVTSVKIDGTEKGIDGSYTIEADTETKDHIINVKDLSGNEIFYTISVNAEGAHSFSDDDWVPLVASTCDTQGMERHRCSACGAAETRTIPVLGHAYKANSNDDAHFVWTATKDENGIINGYTAQVYFICGNDAKHVDKMTCNISETLDGGVKTYTASVTYNGRSFSAQKRVEVQNPTILEDPLSPEDSNIYTATNVLDGAPQTAVTGLDLDTAKALMTKEEQANYDNETVATDVTVYLEVQDITGVASSEDTTKVEAELEDLVTEKENNAADLETKTGAAYLDLSMYKYVKVTETQGDETVVTKEETTPVTNTGKKISITVDIPQDILVAEQGYTRNYYIIRVHDGVIERMIPTRSSDKLTFETDKFSTYAIAYVDVKNTSVTPPSENGGSWVSPSQPEKPEKDDPKDDESKQEEETDDSESESGSTTVSMDTTFRKLHLAEAKATKNTVKVSWKKVTGADGYVLYGAPCNTKDKTYKIKKIAVIKNGSKITYTNKKLKSGTYYKYYIKAYKLVNGKKVWLAQSKVIHVTTSGGKYGNAKAVKVNKTKVILKKGKSLVIKASQIAENKPIKQHANIKFESSNTKIATVTKNGRIKAKKKGTCYIYVYAQNGVYKRIKVVVS